MRSGSRAIIGDLQYELANLEETIRYCQARNSIIRDLSKKKIEEQFWEAIQKSVGSLSATDLAKVENKFMQVLNAWFIIDRNNALPAVGGSKTATHNVNFFVRPGRKPTLKAVDDAFVDAMAEE
jgi:hypothetical protein